MLLVGSLAAGLAFALPPTYPTVPMSGVHGPMEMPLIGLGTWQYNSSQAMEAVGTAFGLGYRHVDTALGYDNQAGVGAALARAALPRSEYFVTSKVPGGLNASATAAALELALQQLRLEFVDLMLLHWPGNGAASRQEQWRALEAFAKQGKARAIGISHYCKRHLDDILAIATLPVALNQVQYHVGMAPQSPSVRHDPDYMKSKGVVYMAYSSLCGPCPDGGHAELISGPLVTAIGKAHNRTGAQVSLRWVVQQGIPVIPKALDKDYLAEDIDVFDFSLEDSEMARLNAATTPPITGTPPQKPDDYNDCQVP